MLRPPVFALFPALAIALLTLGATDAVASYESENTGWRAETTPVDVQPACNVTFKAYHGGISSDIQIDFAESQVRTRVGWWVSLGGARGPISLSNPPEKVYTLRPGNSFEVVEKLDMSCGAHRRYRFYVHADSEQEHVYYYPSENDYTQETVIDLGALNRFFPWIEEGDPIVQSDERIAIENLRLEGEWLRVESNHHPNDGMRINIEGNRATIVGRPATAHPVWSIGRRIWRGIESDGSFEILGSDGNYYPAQIEPLGYNSIDVDVSHGGQGNRQHWERKETGFVKLAPDPNTTSIVDAVVEEEMARMEIVGLAVAIVKGDEIVHAKGYGYADRESLKPVTTETLFRWASTSKTVTSVAALKLWEEGKLDLDEDIRDLVPEYPAKPEGKITMRHLLSNSAGVMQYSNLNDWDSTWDDNIDEDYPPTIRYDPIRAVELFKDAPLLFPPADSFRYSSFGFNLAGAVLERAYDGGYVRLVEDKVMTPLNMFSLQPDYPGRQSSLETRRYRKDRNGVIYRVDSDDPEKDDNASWKLAGGGYQSNIIDMAKFAHGIMAEKVLTSASTDTLTNVVARPCHSDHGCSMSSYAFGIYNEVRSDPARQRIGHAGDQGSEGVRASLYYYPGADLGIAFLANSEHTDRSRLRELLADALGVSYSASDYAPLEYVNCDSALQVDSGNRFAGVWRPGTNGQLVRRGYTTAGFNDERKRLAKLGYSLTDLDTYTNDDGDRLWDGVFTKNNRRYVMWRNFDHDGFLEKWKEVTAEGFRLIDLETYLGVDGKRLWAGVFVEESGRQALWRGQDQDAFHAKWEEMDASGFRLIDVETYVDEQGTRRWAGAFIKSSERQALWRNFETAAFGDKRREMRDQGFRLIDIETYPGRSGQQLWAGVWEAATDDEWLFRNWTYCGSWTGQDSGFWEKHEDALQNGMNLIDFERYENNWN